MSRDQSSFSAFLLILTIFLSSVLAVPSAGAANGTLVTRHAPHLLRRGATTHSKKSREKEAIGHGQLPTKDLRCECKVSEQNIPILGNMGWHFELKIKGFGDGGDKAPECGLGILDNLRGSCKNGADFMQWGCDKGPGKWERSIHWDSSKTLQHDKIELALWEASYNQMGGCKCNYNYGASLAESVVSGIAMAVPIPAAQAAKAVATGAMAIGKAVANVAVKAATNLAKTGVKNTIANAVDKKNKKASAPKKPAPKTPDHKKSGPRKPAPKKGVPGKGAPRASPRKATAHKEASPKAPAHKAPVHKAPAPRKNAPQKPVHKHPAPKKSAPKKPASGPSCAKKTCEQICAGKDICREEKVPGKRCAAMCARLHKPVKGRGKRKRRSV